MKTVDIYEFMYVTVCSAQPTPSLVFFCFLCLFWCNFDFMDWCLLKKMAAVFSSTFKKVDHTLGTKVMQ